MTVESAERGFYEGGGYELKLRAIASPSLLEEALQRSRASGRSQVYAWLIEKMQRLEN